MFDVFLVVLNFLFEPADSLFKFLLLVLGFFFNFPHVLFSLLKQRLKIKFSGFRTFFEFFVLFFQFHECDVEVGIVGGLVDL